ncbi:MAG: hypothetical protein U0271_42035 [Polyangiaceae bacterium]
MLKSHVSTLLIACSLLGGCAEPSKSSTSATAETLITDSSSRPGAKPVLIPVTTSSSPNLSNQIPASLQLTEPGKQAVAKLLVAGHFGGWAVGFAGIPTPEVEALRTVMKTNNAKAALEYVVASGTLAGQLMALAGLWEIDRPTFDALAPRFRTITEKVEVQSSGCDASEGEIEARVILERPDGARLLPKETLSDWSKRNPNAPLNFDIVGGGYTAVMRPLG